LTKDEQRVLLYTPPDWFILKPAVGFGGDGIKIIKNITHF
jgi:hypothetical protein